MKQLPLHILCLPAFEDNYIWVLHNTQRAILIDPGQAEPVVGYLQNKQLALEAILITHQHADHTGGALALQDWSPCPIWSPHYRGLPHGFQPIEAGQSLHLLDCSFQVLATPGHTSEHVSYLLEINERLHLFCGDTLFSAGCGRPFEALGGSHEDLFQSLQTIKNLKSDTLIYPAHEYTLSNIKFALTIEPTNQYLREYCHAVESQRQQGLSTLPTRLDLECSVNPFLRVDSALAFADLRERKNQF